MNNPAAAAETIFAEAIRQPCGRVRDEFVLDRCRNDLVLQQEVESLLAAHERAGSFLEIPRGTDGGTPPQSTAFMNAAAQAEQFLRTARSGEGELDRFIAQLPGPIREEARERINAALRVRQIRRDRGIPSAPAEATPPQLPGFRIEHKVGEGSLGIVYAAHDEKLNRRVAIKVLRPHHNEQVHRRVIQEARHTAAVSHPSIVTVFSVLDETNPPAIVMQFVQGFPLDRFAAQLNFDQKTRLLVEVARALEVAHGQGLIHRDLKPENVLVGPDLQPRLLDFGLALTLEEAAAHGRGFEGTPLYASPEQVLGKPLTTASDVFSFGSLMFKVLCGKPPFAGGTVTEVLEAIATTAPPFLREAAVGVPEDLQAICLACLSWDPADRPTAQDLVLELRRFLLGEPVRLRPKLYDDLLHRSVSEYSNQTQVWERQGIILPEERDALEVVHRKLLAEDDYWIVDARRITLLQSILSGATWCSVVAAILMVWMLRDELSPLSRWLLPSSITTTLLVTGLLAHRKRESLAAATFLAGAALAVAPTMLAVLAQLDVFALPATGVSQLFAAFTNQQVLAASATALGLSIFGLRLLKMTGFAWTTAILVVESFLSFLLLFNWLEKRPEIQALWCLPLIGMESVALLLEKKGRVRWTLPFHLIALLALVGGLDVIAYHGPTLKLLGVALQTWGYFDEPRQQAISFVLNGFLFLGLMLLTRRAQSLDLRRFGKWLETLAIIHVISALFSNSLTHHDNPLVRVDVWLYLGAALFFAILGPCLSRWRMLVGGLIGCGLGCYLLVDLRLVARKPFIIGLGFAGLAVALGVLVFERFRPRWIPPLTGRKQQPQAPDHGPLA